MNTSIGGYGRHKGGSLVQRPNHANNRSFVSRVDESTDNV